MYSRFAPALIILLFSAGCIGVPACRDELNRFRVDQPLEFKKVIYLNPISFNTYKAMMGERSGVVSYILGEIDRRSKENVSVQEFVKEMRKREIEDNHKIIGFFADLEEASVGGVLCQYEWTDGKTKETGFIVLKNGRISKKAPIITDYLSERLLLDSQPIPSSRP